MQDSSISHQLSAGTNYRHLLSKQTTEYRGYSVTQWVDIPSQTLQTTVSVVIVSKVLYKLCWVKVKFCKNNFASNPNIS